MLLFRDEEHVARWCAIPRQPRGEAFPVEQAWNLAQTWYADRLQSGLRPRTVEESQALLTQIGLISPFWKLV
jgi:Alkylmercury lyase